jgi:hypothetical protein
MRWFWVCLNNYFNGRDSSSLQQQKVPNITWTRASKPFNEMSKEEQVHFIHKMAGKIFNNSLNR